MYSLASIEPAHKDHLCIRTTVYGFLLGGLRVSTRVLFLDFQIKVCLFLARESTHNIGQSFGIFPYRAVSRIYCCRISETNLTSIHPPYIPSLFLVNTFFPFLSADISRSADAVSLPASHCLIPDRRLNSLPVNQPSPLCYVGLKLSLIPQSSSAVVTGSLRLPSRHGLSPFARVAGDTQSLTSVIVVMSRKIPTASNK